MLRFHSVGKFYQPYTFSKLGAMEAEDYRILDVEIPTEPIFDTKPWWVAGWLLVFLIAAIMVYCYIKG